MSFTSQPEHDDGQVESELMETSPEMIMKKIENSFEEYYGNFAFITHPTAESQCKEWFPIFLEMKARFQLYCSHLAELIKTCRWDQISSLVRAELTKLVRAPLVNSIGYQTTRQGKYHALPFRDFVSPLVERRSKQEMHMDRRPLHGGIRFQCMRVNDKIVECQWGVRFAFPSAHGGQNQPPGSDGFSNPTTVDVVAYGNFSFDDICKLLDEEPPQHLAPRRIGSEYPIGEMTTLEGNKSTIAQTQLTRGHTGPGNSTYGTVNKKDNLSKYGSMANSIANHRRSYQQVEYDSLLAGKNPATGEAKTNNDELSVWGQLTRALSNATSFSCFKDGETTRELDEKSEYRLLL